MFLLTLVLLYLKNQGKKNSKNSQLLSFEKLWTLNTSALQDDQNEWSLCSIWTAGDILEFYKIGFGRTRVNIFWSEYMTWSHSNFSIRVAGPIKRLYPCPKHHYHKETFPKGFPLLRTWTCILNVSIHLEALVVLRGLLFRYIETESCVKFENLVFEYCFDCS